MMIEFGISNFLSFREKTTLTLVKVSGRELEDSNTFVPDAPSAPALLHSCVLYGANAAGKSNFIKALLVMREVVVESARESQAGEKLSITSFLLDERSCDQPSEFEVTFINQNVRYQYGFAATKNRIIEEWLLAYPSGRPQRWIERRYDEESQSYLWGNMDKLLGKKQVWQEATRSNALFLSTAIQLNNKQLTPVFEFFEKKLRISGIGGWNSKFSIETCEESESRKKIVSFLKAADVDIQDVELEKKKFNPDMIEEDLPEEIKVKIEKEYKDKSVVINVKTAHSLLSGERVLFDMDVESDGTQKIFALAGPWLDSLNNGYVLVLDELHDNLHPLMVKFLVSLFHDKETNPNNAQLIFTTHDTSILNQEVFRRDQVWFCEKDKEHSSKLYSLTDFSPRKGVENLERGYLSGRYGALPYLGNIKKAMGC